MTKNAPNHDNNNDVDTTRESSDQTRKETKWYENPHKERTRKREGTFVDYPGCGFWCLILFSIFFLLASIVTPSILNARRSAFENRCKLTLRSLASAQHTFADAHDGNYATWSELFEEDYPDMIFTRDNMIDNYNIITFEVMKSSGEKDSEDFIISGFTIIAVPRSQKNRLRTFAIGDDQIPRVWVGEESDWEKGNTSLHDKSLWEPLR